MNTEVLKGKRIVVEVAYALPHKQMILSVEVESGTTASEAVTLSGIEKHFLDLDVVNARLGLFGQAFGTKGLDAAESYLLQAGDRIEIYRPLLADPKEVRRKRAEKAKQEEQV